MTIHFLNVIHEAKLVVRSQQMPLYLRRVYLWGRAESGSAIVNDCYPAILFVTRCPKGTLYSYNRTEFDNRIEVVVLKGIAENNLPHIVR